MLLFQYQILSIVVVHALWRAWVWGVWECGCRCGWVKSRPTSTPRTHTLATIPTLHIHSHTYNLSGVYLKLTIEPLTKYKDYATAISILGKNYDRWNFLLVVSVFDQAIDLIDLVINCNIFNGSYLVQTRFRLWFHSVKMKITMFDVSYSEKKYNSLFNVLLVPITKFFCRQSRTVSIIESIWNLTTLR